MLLKETYEAYIWMQFCLEQLFEDRAKQVEEDQHFFHKERYAAASQDFFERLAKSYFLYEEVTPLFAVLRRRFRKDSWLDIPNSVFSRVKEHLYQEVFGELPPKEEEPIEKELDFFPEDDIFWEEDMKAESRL